MRLTRRRLLGASLGGVALARSARAQAFFPWRGGAPAAGSSLAYYALRETTTNEAIVSGVNSLASPVDESTNTGIGSTVGGSGANIGAFRANGQTFVYMAGGDLATGSGGAAYVYQLLRAAVPITSANYSNTSIVTVVNPRIFNNSGQLPGFTVDVPAQVSTPWASTNRAVGTFETQTLPNALSMPQWSRLGVYTTPGQPPNYYKYASGASRVNDAGGTYNPNSLTNATAIFTFQPSGSGDGGELPGAYPYWGDVWLIWGNSTMGWHDGTAFLIGAHALSGIFYVAWQDGIVTGGGAGLAQSNHAGVIALTPPVDPVNLTSTMYPWMFNRLAFVHDVLLPTVYAGKYNPNDVELSGDCMGATGSLLFAGHYRSLIPYLEPDSGSCNIPDYPIEGWPLQGNVNGGSGSNDTVYAPPSGITSTPASTIPVSGSALPWGGTSGWGNSGALLGGAVDQPYLNFSLARYDDIYTEMWYAWYTAIAAFQANTQGHLVLWTCASHGTGPPSNQQYFPTFCQPPSAFVLNKSYPCFSAATHDDQIGTGTRTNGSFDGDQIGCVNFGWQWSGAGISGSITDTTSTWSVVFSNNYMGGKATIPNAATLAAAIPASGNGAVAVNMNGAVNYLTSAQTFQIDNEIFISSTLSGGTLTYFRSNLPAAPNYAAHSIGAAVIQYNTNNPAANLFTGPIRGPYAHGAVNVMPRHRQSFKPPVSATVRWSVTYGSGATGASGTVTVDANGNFFVNVGYDYNPGVGPYQTTLTFNYP